MEKQITVKSLKKGVKIWKGRFPKENDFHNAFYHRLAEINNEGIFCESWNPKDWRYRILRELGKWYAIRPFSYCQLERRMKPAFLQELQGTVNKLRKDMQKHGISDIASDKASWGLCEPLFEMVRPIKPVKHNAPTFPAKLCHFIFPALFPVSDVTMVKISDACEYPGYWKCARECWKHSKREHRRLKGVLCEAIKQANEEELLDGYPFACKIAELHVIGKGGYSACCKG